MAHLPVPRSARPPVVWRHTVPVLLSAAALVVLALAVALVVRALIHLTITLGGIFLLGVVLAVLLRLFWFLRDSLISLCRRPRRHRALRLMLGTDTAPSRAPSSARRSRSHEH